MIPPHTASQPLKPGKGNMETETLMLNLSSQAAAALTLLTATAGTQAAAQTGIERSASGQLWSDMKQRWLPANGRDG